jgi:phospholipid/cholesterol/gamma-HCH transport system ATP-binding protein
MTTNHGERATGPALEFRGVSIAFDELQVLRDVSFTLQPNEMLFVTGASGSGKTVLLHLAMGILRPDEGQIFIQGREITALSEDEMLTIRGERLGLVFQDEALFTGMDVYDNAAYRLEEHDWPPEKVDAAVREVLGFVGLSNEMSTEVFELSGGMKRRLELARAIVGWPPIMLFDEPTTGLDPINAQQVRDMIIGAREFHAMSSLYVSKAMNELKYLTTHYAQKDEQGNVSILEASGDRRPMTRVMVLDEGRIAFLGSYDEFCASSVPSVVQMRQPRSSQTESDYHARDPWGTNRKLPQEIF